MAPVLPLALSHRFERSSGSPVSERQDWPPLTSLERSRLFVQLREHEKRAVRVVCNMAICSDLATSLIAVFRRSGWSVLGGHEGREDDGVIGVVVLSGSDGARQLWDAIDATTSLHPQFVAPGSLVPASSIVLVIGTKPPSRRPL